MENRGNRTGQELAETKKELYGFRASARAARNEADDQAVTPPEIKIFFDEDVNSFCPGDFLICEYQVGLESHHDVQAIETSVIWLTEGKGECDIGVHFFERRQKQSVASETFRLKQPLSTVLPASPLSYEGQIVKVRWCVRVRIFLADGEQFTEDEYFRLGAVEAFQQGQSESFNDSDESSESSESGAA